MPQQFIERAKQAIEKAKKANASKFARDELTQAESAWTLPHLVDTEKSQYLLTKEDWHGIGEEAQII